jgi:hypothetical protein
MKFNLNSFFKSGCSILWIFLLLANADHVLGQYSIENTMRKYRSENNVIHYGRTGDLSFFFNENDPSIKSKIEMIDVLVFNSQAGIKVKDMDKITQTLSQEAWDALLDIKDQGTNVRIFTLDKKDYTEKLFANIKSDNQQILFLIKGKIYPADLSKINFDFAGSEFLNKLGG